MRLIGLAVGLTLGLLAPLAAEAQRVPEIGVLVFGTGSRNINIDRVAEPLRAALRDFGWIEGQNISLQLQFADLKEDRLTALAQELVQQKVDLIVAVGTQATQAARRATASIPIVMSTSGDPIGSGIVRNLARPEANVTGTSLVFTDVAGKRLQLLQEVMSRVSRAAVLSSGTDFRRAWKAATTYLGLAGRILHDFRRTAVRNLERAGVSRSVAMKMTGHKTEAVYRRYAIVSEADLHEAARKLAAIELGKVQGKVGDGAESSPGENVAQLPERMAEGEGFEPPKASRPGGFQVRTAPPLTMS
jgi:ABC transporter substrate binding protein